MRRGEGFGCECGKREMSDNMCIKRCLSLNVGNECSDTFVLSSVRDKTRGLHGMTHRVVHEFTVVVKSNYREKSRCMNVTIGCGGHQPVGVTVILAVIHMGSQQEKAEETSPTGAAQSTTERAPT